MSEKQAEKIIEHNWDNGIFECKSSNLVLLKIEVITEHIIRVRYGTESYFLPDFSYGLDPSLTVNKVASIMEETPKSYVISTSAVKCHVNKADLKVTFRDNEGQILNEDEKGFHWEISESTGNDIVQMTKYVQNDEVFYGLGDKPSEMNLKHRRFENWGTDSYGYDYNTDPLYKNIPFYYGLHHGIGYGIFFDNSFRTFFDFGKERANATSFWSHGGEMNYYFIAGPNLMDVAERYALLTGTPDMPAMWSLGFQQCKWSYYPESQVREVTSKMRELNIPCDAIYLDIDYMDGFRCFTWDTERFPDHKKMIADLKDQGYKTMVIIDPGIKKDHDYWVFKEGLEKDLYCKHPDGPYVEGKVWPEECYFPDYTNPEAREWWAGLYKGLIEEDGIAGVWNDMNEPAIFEVESKTFSENVLHHYEGLGASHSRAHNVYGMQMARATYEGVKRYSDNKRGLIITRSGYSGLQRYSSVWTGDNIATWQHIWLANVQCQRLAISGISFAGSDIGGFIGKPSPEMFVRWIQLGIFHSFCRVHSSQDDGDQEPWSFGEEALDLFREAVELRYQMLPYHYTTFYQNHRFGTPYLRPLTFVDQGDPQNYGRDHEFLCGDNILSASIDQEGITSKAVYLPEGTWYNYWNDHVSTGRQSVDCPLTKSRYPLYVKAGSVLPYYPLQQYTDEININEVKLSVYHINGSHFSHLYEDDHDGYQYETGDFRYSTFEVTGTDESLTISQSSEGSFQPKYGFKLDLHGLPFDAKGVVVDGKEIYLDAVVPYDFKEIVIK